MKPFKPDPRLIIPPNIKKKIWEDHGVSTELARAIFDLFWRNAIPHPVDPGDPAWTPPRFVLEERFQGKLYRLVFNLESPPGLEAILVTVFPERKLKHVKKGPKS